jgi:hypothetical protein
MTKKTTGPKESVQPVIPVSKKDNGWSQFEEWAGQSYFPEDKAPSPRPKKRQHKKEIK